MPSSFTSFYNPKYVRKQDEPYPTLSISNQAQRKIWLVKVPKFLSEQWKQASDGSRLAKLVMNEPSSSSSSFPSSSSNISIYLPELDDLKETQAPEVPTQFQLNFINTKVTNTFVFSDTKLGYAEAVQGQITSQAVMAPTLNQVYHQMNKKRTQQAAIHSKQTKLVGKEELARNLGLGFAVSSQDSIFAQKYLKQKPTETRKERLPQSQLLQLLMHLFEEYPYWSLKGLTERTHQSNLYIKEVLPFIAKLNKRGPYSGMYSMLPELKHPNDLNSSSSSSFSSSLASNEVVNPSTNLETESGPVIQPTSIAMEVHEETIAMDVDAPSASQAKVEDGEEDDDDEEEDEE